MEEIKLTLGQNIKALINKSPYKTLFAFHKAIVGQAKGDAISYSSLHNVVNDTKRPEERTLKQIAHVLKMKISDLRKGTVNESLKTRYSTGSYSNNMAIFYNLYHNLPFQPQLIKIKGHGATSEEKEHVSHAKTYKFFYICNGTVDLILKQENAELERREFRKGDVFCFDASVLHHFENRKIKNVEILLVSFTNPAS